MLRPLGYAVKVDPTAPSWRQEMDTITCGHCQVITPVQPFGDPADIKYGGKCKMCMRLICRTCYEKFINGDGCDPFEKKLDRIEAQDRFARSAGLA